MSSTCGLTLIKKLLNFVILTDVAVGKDNYEILYHIHCLLIESGFPPGTCDDFLRSMDLAEWVKGKTP